MKKITISVDDNFVRELDMLCGYTGRSKSNYIRFLVQCEYDAKHRCVPDFVDYVIHHGGDGYFV